MQCQIALCSNSCRQSSPQRHGFGMVWLSEAEFHGALTCSSISNSWGTPRRVALVFDGLLHV